MEKKNNFGEIARLFSKMGTIAFGGPAAHIAMMEDEVVEKRKWMSREHFLDLVGATNLIPGPNSTEMTMHCGHERGGALGLFTAGVSFILPAVLITMVFAWLYKDYGDLPEIEKYIYGIKPAVIAIILSAVYKLGKKALKNWELGILGVSTLVACLLGVHEIMALFACGVVGVIWFYIKKASGVTLSISPFLFFKLGFPLLKISQLKVFLIFLKIGAILYGSGYVLFAFLEAELVSTGLLSREVIIDAVAVGQMTPGPVLTTATFIGWQLYGVWGAIAATVGIFLPSFLFVLILNPLIPKMRQSKPLSAFLDAVNIAAVAVIIAVCYDMAKDSIFDWKTGLIAVMSLIMVFGFKKVNSAFIVIGGSIIGLVLSYI